jgi:hydroxypyruvate isomerase
VSQWSRASCSDVFTRNLCWAADQALTFGITLLLEPLNEANHPDYFYHTIEEAAVALRYIARPNVKLQFDTYHVGMQGGDTVGALHRHWPLIGHVQIASVPDRGEPKCSDSDIVEVMHAVDSLGYNGWIGCEYRPRDDTDAGLGWIAQLSLSTSSQ